MNNESRNQLAWTNWVAGVAVGVLAMYFSDPDRGRRRRALVRDQIRHFARQTRWAIDVASRDFGNRVQGVRARARHLVSREWRHVPDVVLEERVRARLGRATSHPRAVKVLAQDGWINLSGAILAQEKDDVLNAVQGTPGVSGISDNMQSYESPEHIPSLQGNHDMQRLRSPLAPDNWSPSTRALAAIGGCLLGSYGLIRRSPGNVALAGLGLGLMATGILVNPRRPRRRHEYEQEYLSEQERQESLLRERETARAAGTTGTAAQPQQKQQPVTQPAGSLLH